ncbi:MAG TPA: AAA family ATPase [Candidatus Syntrophosphaera sp.]|nr:AAA family ATPase [Candidatus Syntrophosphaera sp.]
MTLEMTINNIKSIGHLKIELPVDKGLYAITGQNGSGKSTVVTCASSVFFNMIMKDYFGSTASDASIVFQYGDAHKSYKKNDSGRWFCNQDARILLKGFYEGSLIFGNRFRNTTYNNLRKLDRINESYMMPGPDFIRNNLGIILHNNASFYEKLYVVDPKRVGGLENFYGDIFYYEIQGKKVSQFHMSTGENLLISILNSLNRRNSDRKTLDVPCILLLDEIELALHPSSLKRLINFLGIISNEYNYAIYFSTHSLELISAIKPDNIFYLDRHSDHTLELINPCYPAYATRMLYDHTGYDYVILVEDELAKEIIIKILKYNKLWGSRLTYVLPCGGYGNVIDLADEVVSGNLLGKISKICIVLDADIEKQANTYIKKHNIKNNIPLNYLPVKSLEKFIRHRLFDDVDHVLFRRLNDFVFHQKSLTSIIEEYKSSLEFQSDASGKKLFKRIDVELKARGKDKAEIIDLIVDYLIENDKTNINRIISFLDDQLCR